jgi:hypothetical protein
MDPYRSSKAAAVWQRCVYSGCLQDEKLLSPEGSQHKKTVRKKGRAPVLLAVSQRDLMMRVKGPRSF